MGGCFGERAAQICPSSGGNAGFDLHRRLRLRAYRGDFDHRRFSPLLSDPFTRVVRPSRVGIFEFELACVLIGRCVTACLFPERPALICCDNMVVAPLAVVGWVRFTYFTVFTVATGRFVVGP